MKSVRPWQVGAVFLVLYMIGFGRFAFADTSDFLSYAVGAALCFVVPFGITWLLQRKGEPSK